MSPKAFRKNRAFSLAEVTMAIGVTAFAFLGVLGLMPVGMRSVQDATEQARATNTLNLATAAVRSQLFFSGTTSTTPFLPLAQAISEGNSADFDVLEDSSLHVAGTVPAGRSRLHVQIYRPDENNPEEKFSPTRVYLTVAWPGTATYKTTGTVGWGKQLGYVETLIYINPPKSNN